MREAYVLAPYEQGGVACNELAESANTLLLIWRRVDSTSPPHFGRRGTAKGGQVLILRCVVRGIDRVRSSMLRLRVSCKILLGSSFRVLFFTSSQATRRPASSRVPLRFRQDFPPYPLSIFGMYRVACNFSSLFSTPIPAVHLPIRLLPFFISLAAAAHSFLAILRSGPSPLRSGVIFSWGFICFWGLFFFYPYFPFFHSFPCLCFFIFRPT